MYESYVIIRGLSGCWEHLVPPDWDRDVELMQLLGHLAIGSPDFRVWASRAKTDLISHHWQNKGEDLRDQRVCVELSS